MSLPVCPKCGSPLGVDKGNARRQATVECTGWGCDFSKPVSDEEIIRTAMAEPKGGFEGDH